MQAFLDWIHVAVAHDASDLHLTMDLPPVMRCRGHIRRMDGYAVTDADLQSVSATLLNEHDQHLLRMNGQCDVGWHVPGCPRIRVHAYRQSGQISFSIRILSTTIPQYADLRLPDTLLQLVQQPHGLILVTGPAGSGKSTTLAAVVDWINQHQPKRIITLEDPIEYVHEHHNSMVEQREIGRDTDSFSSGLRSALRQDPDVLMVGEMRDYETIATAVTAAETGHLVLATLHTRDAPSAIDRIVDVFPASQQKQIRIQLADVLIAVLAQRLVPTKDGTGRVALTEFLVNTPAVANLIRTEKTHHVRNQMQIGRAYGMHTLSGCAKDLLQAGLIRKDQFEALDSERHQLFNSKE